MNGSDFTLVAATVAGRLSDRVSAHWLIGPGQLLVGVALLLMTALSADLSWTALALIGAVCAVVFIRDKDFHLPAADAGAAEPEGVTSGSR